MSGLTNEALSRLHASWTDPPSRATGGESRIDQVSWSAELRVGVVSAVLPTFNRARRFLARSIESVFDQFGFRGYDPSKGPGLDTSQFLYRREVYARMPLVFCRMECDWNLCRSIWARFPGFVYVPTIVCEYVWHGDNRSLNPVRRNAAVSPADFKEYFDSYSGLYEFDLSPR